MSNGSCKTTSTHASNLLGSAGFTRNYALSILFILLFPRRKGTFELKEEQGKLVLHRKAIEGFVRSSLQDSDFLEAPTIRVKATKRRIKVNVKGTLKRTADLIQTEAWSKTMEERLARLVGTGHKITIDVHFEDIQSMKRPQQQQTQARVDRRDVQWLNG